MDRTPYRRRVAYYETDQMGIVHHSNYIRWFEEARTDFMRRNGVLYAEMERLGVMIPVISVTCDYKLPARNDELIDITTRIQSYSGVRLILSYEVRSADTGELLVTGASGHCFIDALSRKPLNLRRRLPEHHARVAALLKEEQA